MAFRKIGKKVVPVEFRQIGQTGVFIAQAEADHKNSMSILQQNGFRPLTYQEVVVRTDQSPELKEQLKGKAFYLDGEGCGLSGYCIFDDKGELTKEKLTQEKGNMEKTIYVFKGKKPLSLEVRKDFDARYEEGRYVLDALASPEDVALVVVGVKIANEMRAERRI